MIIRGIVICLAVFWAWTSAAFAADECAPGALGTSRVIYVDPAEHPLVGSIQYRETIPLKDHEVVITFDDGPSRVYTPKILDALKAECVKATFFMVGTMAHNAPAVVKRVYDEGHAIADHSQTHPLNMQRLPAEIGWRNMMGGRETITEVLGEGRAMTPFIRYPGLGRTRALDAKAKAEQLMVWSADIYADDWLFISSSEVVRRPLERLERVGKGVVLFHDIHRRTVDAIPRFLQGLKERGFKVVLVMPASAEHPKTETTLADWAAMPKKQLGLPAHMMRDDWDDDMGPY